MALNQYDADNEELLSRVSKAADGTDTAYKDMVLCQVESVLMGDPLALGFRVESDVDEEGFRTNTRLVPARAPPPDSGGVRARKKLAEIVQNEMAALHAGEDGEWDNAGAVSYAIADRFLNLPPRGREALRPIEEAPKDGTWVLLYSTGINTKYSHWTVGKWRSVGRTSERGPGWYDHDIFPIHNAVGFVLLPPEDMPLPVSPSFGKTGGGK